MTDEIWMKVRYNGGDCAYLDTEHEDGSFSGVNKYSDLPVRLRFDRNSDEWFELDHLEGEQ